MIKENRRLGLRVELTGNKNDHYHWVILSSRFPGDRVWTTDAVEPFDDPKEARRMFDKIAKDIK